MSAPLVSILIPTHERPDYLKLAVESALAQRFGDFEILISDNGASEASVDALRPLIGADDRVRHLRCPERRHYLENWLNALAQARGDYIAFLMDDDLFHPEKLARMVPLLRERPEVALVTSYRQLIDPQGRPIPDLPETAPLFGDDAVVNGVDLGNRVLHSGANVIGEPTTAMFRRAELGASFGFYAGRQYQVLSDVATWLRLMAGRRVIVLREALSYFRLHPGQDQRRALQAVQANVEWLQLLLDARDQGPYLQDEAAFRRTLRAQIDSLVPFLTKNADAIRDGDCHVEPLQAVLRQAFDALLH